MVLRNVTCLRIAPSRIEKYVPVSVMQARNKGWSGEWRMRSLSRREVSSQRAQLLKLLRLLTPSKRQTELPSALASLAVVAVAAACDDAFLTRR